MKIEALSWKNTYGIGYCFTVRSPFSFSKLQPQTMQPFFVGPWFVSHGDLPEAPYRITSVESGGFIGTVPEGATIRLFAEPVATKDETN